MLSKLGGFSVFFVGIVLVTNLFARAPLAQKGILDAQTWNFNENLLALNGEWVFFKNELFSPEECRSQKGIYSDYPALWNDAKHEGIGFGTYYLKVIVSNSVTSFALEIPQVYSSCRLWVNDQLIARAGEVGKTKETTTPQWIYQTASFENSKDTLSIVIQIANFHHYKGGSANPLILGSSNTVLQSNLWTRGANVMELILLFLTGSVFLFFYLHKNTDRKEILYFSLLCFTWSIRASFSNQYLVVSVFPNFNWAMLVKTEYLTLYGGIIWATLLLNHLFKNIGNQILTSLIVVLNIFFSVFTLFTSPLIFSHWIIVYLTIAGVTMLYATITIFRALFLNQAGAWFLLFSLMVSVVVFGYDLFAYENSQYDLILLYVGYIVVFVLVTLALLFHLGLLKEKWHTNEVLTFNEMIKDSRTGD